jgi:diaminohydroxyphosphoribosylaminopyrimidine deaminase / 5-amino-6-(5-phosphoribosylamino)uracil reductase
LGKLSEPLTALDRLYLERTYELAGRGLGSTMPNPPVGAVVVRDGRIVGEGYHHRAGDAHAEAQALARAGSHARGATVYVSLEPCLHVGRTPPCTDALIASGVARVIAGTLDPTEHGGAELLREHGIEVSVADDRVAAELIEIFSRVTSGTRPYVALKMAASLDGVVARRPGMKERIGSPAEEGYVRNLRTAYDAVMVGAGTVRVDDPLLTVRPAFDRARPYARIVLCDRRPISAQSRVLAPQEGYRATIVLAPTGRRDRFEELRGIANVIFVGADDSEQLDITAAMKALREREIFSVLCEGGPKLGASLLAANIVDRVYWAIAPRFLSGPDAVPALSGADLSQLRVRFDRIDSAGPDVILSGHVSRV